ncbi:MAG: RelE-like translational repressor toxin [uncultured Microvirga sp.]|uniref:RelE-like translational repressor toxin n=1 Tax=uncultured Microvirga sp. TaxID=412392 RepID=A0A6J4L7N6_9HYPH|nr:MAG: RelE-like translational repressor toxin [uncultured Microvirga sp.]
MHTVIETGLFLRRAAEAGMTDAERFELVGFIAAHPESGDVIQGTGGVRKLRFAGQGKGKSGGYRVITFFTGANLPVFVLTVFAKGALTNLSKAERNSLQKLTAILADTYARKVSALKR